MLAMWKLRRRRPHSRWSPDCRALRAVQAPQQVKNAGGQWVISSAAFSASKSDASCSVDIEPLLTDDGLDARALYPTLVRTVGLFAVLVRDIRANTLELHHEPVRSNWYHGGLRGAGLSSHKTRKALARACQVVVPIDQEAASQLDKEAADAKQRSDAQQTLTALA